MSLFGASCLFLGVACFARGPRDFLLGPGGFVIGRCYFSLRDFIPFLGWCRSLFGASERFLGAARVRFGPGCAFSGGIVFASCQRAFFSVGHMKCLVPACVFFGIFFGGSGPACIFFGWLCIRFGPGCVSSGGSDFAFGQHAFPRPRLLAAWPRLAFSQAGLMLCRVILRFLRKAYSRFGPAGLTSAGHCFLPGASARFL